MSDIEFYRKRKKYAITKLGSKCNSCSVLEKLEFDHIDPKEKIFSINKILRDRIGILDKELEKCQLLCHSCHIKKSSKEQSIRQKRDICYRGHPRTPENLTSVGNCKKCRAIYMKAYYANNKAKFN